MVKNVTVKGYTYTAGLTRQNLCSYKSKEEQKNCFNCNEAAANFDRIDTNKDSILSEEEITVFKKERNKKITKGVLIGLGIVASVTLIAVGMSKGVKKANLNSSCSTNLSSVPGVASRSSGSMSRAEFVSWWHRNNSTYPDCCHCHRDFYEYISDLYEDYLSGRLHI